MQALGDLPNHRMLNHRLWLNACDNTVSVLKARVVFCGSTSQSTCTADSAANQAVGHNMNSKQTNNINIKQNNLIHSRIAVYLHKCNTHYHQSVYTMQNACSSNRQSCLAKSGSLHTTNEDIMCIATCTMRFEHTRECVGSSDCAVPYVAAAVMMTYIRGAREK